MKSSYRNLESAELAFFISLLSIWISDRVFLVEQPFGRALGFVANALLILQVFAFFVVLIYLPSLLLLLLRSRPDRTLRMIAVGLIGLTIVLGGGAWMFNLFETALSLQN